jgi:tetratricopeptide (TPR) repeat protein
MTPRERALLIASAQEALDKGMVADALRLARYAAERAADAETLELLGRTLLAEASVGEPRGRAARRLEAADAYRRAADAAPDRAGLQNAAALVLDTAGLRDDALRLHDRAVALAPDHGPHRLHRANLRLRMGDLEGAAADREVLARIPEFAAWTSALEAELELAAGRFVEARDAATLALAAAPRDRSLRVLVARVERLAGAPERSVELLAALPAEERDRGATAELALAWSALGRFDRAAEAWEALAAADPADPLPLLDAARARLAAGDRMRARVLADRAALLAPDDPTLAELERAIAAPR